MDETDSDISEENYGEEDEEESSVDDDEMSPEEDAFVHGHDEANDLKEDKEKGDEEEE